MKRWTVYKHISPSGKVYVGISSDIKRRWTANGYYYHLSDTVFSRALNKYGWQSFQHIIIAEDLSKQEACDMEKELIAYYKAKNLSYNITDGGEGTSGFKPSKKQVQNRIDSRIANSSIDYLVIDKNFNYVICSTQIEVAKFLGGVQGNISHVLHQPIGYTFRKHYIWKHEKGTPIDIDFIKSQILSALDIRHKKFSENGKIAGSKGIVALRKRLKEMSPEERKIKYGHGDKHRGMHHSDEAKRKMSEKAKGRDMSKVWEARKKHPYNPTHTKPVIQYTIAGELVKEYSSITNSSIETSIGKSAILNCLSGISKTSGGYKWQYKT